jgi:hypothetical protein
MLGSLCGPLLLYRFDVLATRAVEEINLRHLFEVEMAD